MKDQSTYSVFVMVGQWNYAIFNHEWVAKYLIPNKDLNVEIPLNTFGSMKISTDELSIFVIDGKLNIQILKHSDEVLEKIGDIAMQIADYLPHTPVSAFGINYVFEQDHSGKMDELFKFEDSGKLATIGGEPDSTIITRRIKNDDYVLTFMIAKNETNYTCNFNYNFVIKSMVEFKSKFDSKLLVEFKKNSINMLTDLYNFDLK